MPVASNSIPTLLQQYAAQSLEQNITDTPLLQNVWLNLSDEVSTGGQAVITRLPTTVYSTPGDLTTGWPDTPFSASNITTTLKAGVYNHLFDELQWATIGPQMLQNVTFPSLAAQLFNGITVDALNNLSSSAFTNTITVNSASNFSLATLQSGSNKLTTLEAPRDKRLAIVTPNAFQYLISSITPAYVYGGVEAIQNYNGIRVAGFDPVIEYARLVNSTPIPGGSKYSNLDKPLAYCMAKTGLVVAFRAPVDVSTGNTFTGTATKNGISLQTRISYDVSKPGWRVAAVSIYGTSAGNTAAVVPVLSLSTV